MPTPLELMSHRRAIVRQVAKDALGAIGPGVIEAEPTLRKVSKDANEIVSHLAQRALRRIQTPTDKP